jgi:hypothetical protein
VLDNMHLSNRDLAKILKRSTGSIRRAKWRLNFRIITVRFPEEKIRNLPITPWTPEEEERLWTLRGVGLTWPEIGKELNRSPKACHNKGKRLGLVPKKWRKKRGPAFSRAPEQAPVAQGP